MGKWIHQSHVDETVGWFVRHAMPDAEPGWEDLPWRIEEMGRTDDRGFWWLVTVDIPTSVRGMDCWLSFRVVESGSGDRDHEDMWVSAPDDEEDDE